MSEPIGSDRLPVIIATSGGNFGEPRGAYFDCDLENEEDCYARTTDSIDKLMIESAGVREPSVLCITTGSDPRLKDTEAFDTALADRFKRAGASSTEVMALTYYGPDDEEMKSQIGSADVIYISGGTSHLLNATLRRRGADELLREAAMGGTVLCGLSAGLCCWFSHVNSAVTFDDVVVTRGLGWHGALVAPHWDIEPMRHRPFHMSLLERPGLVGLAFDEHTGIEIRGDRYRLHSFAGGGKVRRGHYCEETGVYSFSELEFCTELKELEGIGIGSGIG